MLPSDPSKIDETGHVTARSRQTGNEAAANRIGNVRENNRDGARVLQQRRGRRRVLRKNHVWLQPDEFLGMLLRRLHVRRPAAVDPDAAILRPSELLEFFLERSQAGLIFGIVLGSRHQHADPAHPIRLLRARRERPRGRSAYKERDELASSHCLMSRASHCKE